MKKVKVVKKVIVREKKDVTPEAIQNEVSRILAVEAFNRWRDFFEMDDAIEKVEKYADMIDRSQKHEEK